MSCSCGCVTVFSAKKRFSESLLRRKMKSAGQHTVWKEPLYDPEIPAGTPVGSFEISETRLSFPSGKPGRDAREEGEMAQQERKAPETEE